METEPRLVPASGPYKKGAGTPSLIGLANHKKSVRVTYVRDDSPFAGALHVGDELISINGDASSCSNAKRASAQCLKEEVLELVVQTPLGKSKKGNSMNLRSSSRKK